MIPIQASPYSRRRYVANVISVFESATEEQVQAGRAWYPTAHRIADMMCDGDVRMGAGLLAALSPQTSWPLNVELATQAVESGTPRRHMTDALSKAARIMSGENPADILPMDRKTGHFYRCILNPSDARSVCIDRHAHDVAVGRAYGSEDRGLSSRGRYALLVQTYREAAKRLGELPQVVQAVTWVVWRESIAGTSTRGGLS